jgi:hypothetical protein
MEKISKDFIFLGDNLMFDCSYDLTSVILDSNKYIQLVIEDRINSIETVLYLLLYNLPNWDREE